MPESSAKLTPVAAQAGASDPVAQTLDFLKVILPSSAVHIVSIRRHQDPAQKSVWMMSPGTFHVQRGDLIYWSVSDNAATIKLDTRIIGVGLLEVPFNGTSMGTVQPQAPGNGQIYKVVLASGTVVTDDGGDPTIIID